DINTLLESSELSLVEHARYQLILGMLYNERPREERGNYEARIAFQQAVEDARAAADVQLESFALYYTALAFYDSRQFPASESWFSVAYDQGQRTGNTFTQGRVRLKQGLRALSE